MKLKFIFFYVGLIAGCGDGNEKNKVHVKDIHLPTAKKEADAMRDKQEMSGEDSVPRNVQVDSVILLAFQSGSSSLHVEGHLNDKGSPVICYFPSDKGKNLVAKVIPKKRGANIRFSQLYFPDGSSQGPFSPLMNHRLDQKGIYKLYIETNPMAGKHVSTDFMLSVKLE